MDNLKKISTILSNGTKVEYNVILTFKSILKSSIVYFSQLSKIFLQYGILCDTIDKY